MVLSRTCSYGLLAMLFIATEGKEDQYVPIHKISGTLNISFHFLTKILQRLAAHHILESSRGPRGGVRLSRPASEISVMDVVSALDGDKIFEGCVLGLPNCGEDTPCPLHDTWSKSRELILNSFRNTRLSQLSKEIQKGNLRITLLPTKGKQDKQCDGK